MRVPAGRPLDHLSPTAAVRSLPSVARDTFARHLVEADVPVTSIQRLLGHARVRTTELYLHVSDPQVQADYQAAMEEVSQRLALDEGGDR
ncbi:MAG: tyrosine-type recombinase/integrase [Chloroflexi bacterium]|nr:tyrosine-type recombinase/integrase [Chloroflexota bacterium]